MHFLCLHGAGTNSKIFELQTAALRYELGGNHTYEFVEGTVIQDKAPGIESLAAYDDLYYGYYKPHCSESFDKAVRDLKRYIKTDGPFDGLISFSQGTSLASAFLADKSQFHELGIRCAMFFSGRTPFVDCGTASSSFASCSDSTEGMDGLICIPTVHIWGAGDKIEPGQALALSELCLAQKRHIYVHCGAHEVPGPKDREGLVESVNAMRSMLAQLR